jgi:hypothetical protein
MYYTILSHLIQSIFPNPEDAGLLYAFSRCLNVFPIQRWSVWIPNPTRMNIQNATNPSTATTQSMMKMLNAYKQHKQMPVAQAAQDCTASPCTTSSSSLAALRSMPSSARHISPIRSSWRPLIPYHVVRQSGHLLLFAMPLLMTFRRH